MFGISRNTVCNMFRELGIPFRGNVSEVRTGRNDEFWAWVNSTNEVMQDVNEEPSPVAEIATPIEQVMEPAEKQNKPPMGAGIPINGVLEFSNTTAQDAFNAAYALLTTVELQKLVITWEAAND